MMYGSKEVGGNGKCYECHANNARSGHFNCEECASKKVVSREKRYSIEYMQRRLKEIGRKVGKSGLDFPL